MPDLVLGPLLRHVNHTSATVWVETTEACAVTVLGATTRTFEVCGHHYALVVLDGLEPGTANEYGVQLDGEPVWPPAAEQPPSRIFTLSHEDSDFRIVFGSCRKPLEMSALGRDALVAYARRLSTRDAREYPESLLLLGDQIYADETTDEMQEWLAKRRDLGEPPGKEVADYEEYAQLYREAWSDPWLRWLLSTVPTSMIFDDHDVRDDWNTSGAWRAEMAGKPWWPKRIQGALASYWVYQHIGNLSPDELATETMFKKVTDSGQDNAEILHEFAREADLEADGGKGARWSYRRDFGPVRLIVIDTRAGRVVGNGYRCMLDDDEFGWIEENTAGDYAHLLIGSSLPWLLPPLLSHLQSINEVAAERPGARGRLGEKIRQAADLEHWAAFRTSFDRLTRLIDRLCHQEKPPASISALSGDVHHAYVAKADFAGSDTQVHQLTCSPLHNTVPFYMRGVFRMGWWTAAASLAERWALRVGVPPLPVRWRRVSGPLYGNAIATIDISDRRAVAFLERSTDSGLVPLPTIPLTT